jgi:hypothetical protein
MAKKWALCRFLAKVEKRWLVVQRRVRRKERDEIIRGLYSDEFEDTSTSSRRLVSAAASKRKAFKEMFNSEQ